MGRQAFPPPTPCNRKKKQPLLIDKPQAAVENIVEGKNGRRLERSDAIPPKRVGEVAGGATAECAAVCCCCPCALMNMVRLAVYEMPARLCRKARKRRQKQRKRRHGVLITAGPGSEKSREELEWEVREAVERGGRSVGEDGDDLEKEMWERFQGTGFWRSWSLRDKT